MSRTIVPAEQVHRLIVDDARGSISRSGNSTFARNGRPGPRHEVELVEVAPITPIVPAKHVKRVAVHDRRVRVSRRGRESTQCPNRRPSSLRHGELVEVVDARRAVEAREDVERAAPDDRDVAVPRRRRRARTWTYRGPGPFPEVELPAVVDSVTCAGRGRARLGPNDLKIGKETTHDLV